MKKELFDNKVKYSLAWSKLYKYDKYVVRSKIPDLPGLVFLVEKKGSSINELLIYSCWREGCRTGLNRLLDPIITGNDHLRKSLEGRNIYFKYTVTDTNYRDVQDVMASLIRRYQPELNDASYNGTGRYESIYLYETERSEEDIIEKIPGRNIHGR